MEFNTTLPFNAYRQKNNTYNFKFYCISSDVADKNPNSEYLRRLAKGICVFSNKYLVRVFPKSLNVFEVVKNKTKMSLLNVNSPVVSVV